MRKIFSLVLAFLLLTTPVLASDSGEYEYATDSGEVDASIFDDSAVPAIGESLDISTPSAILIEKETGTVLFEKDADKVLEPASVTKVMTILLITEALERGELSLDETVTCSAEASSMGGSQIYLKEGEQMTVKDLLKSIVVVSANDAAVCMAEHICGSEAEFVSKMNERAAQLGMKNTNFTNCTGLHDDPKHVTTARDIAIMSRELIKHDFIKSYTTIWTDSVRNGEFGLSNTNKLIRFYKGATGLKTGFTSRSMYCLSATAERDGTEYIAVVLHGETSTERFDDAKTLLNYAFANFALVSATPEECAKSVSVKLGKDKSVETRFAEHENIVCRKSEQKSIRTTLTVCDTVEAPVQEGDKLGEVKMYKDDELLMTYDIVAAHSVERLTFFEIAGKIMKMLFGGTL